MYIYKMSNICNPPNKGCSYKPCADAVLAELNHDFVPCTKNRDVDFKDVYNKMGLTGDAGCVLDNYRCDMNSGNWEPEYNLFSPNSEDSKHSKDSSMPLSAWISICIAIMAVIILFIFILKK
jgi:hypothetical protein